MTTVLAIEQAATATKAVVIGGTGRVLAHSTVRVTTRTLADGGMEQDPVEIWHGVRAAARKAIDQAGRRIDVVALATGGGSVLAFDPTFGTPLSPVITRQDRRAAGICQDLASHAETLAEETGLRLSPQFSASKLAWLRKNVTRDGVVAGLDAWLVHQLTGQYATDAATASRSVLVDLDSGTWDPRLAAVFGLGQEPMPRIVANDEIVGETDAFGPRVPVAGVILEAPAALLAQRCLNPGGVNVTYGVGASLLTNLGTRPTRSELTCSTAWRIQGARTFCLDGQVAAASSALSWLVKIGVLDRIEALDDSCAKSPGQTVFVPGFDEEAGARLVGLDLSTTGEQIVSAVVYGIAAAVADLYDLAGLKEEVLRVDGGLAKSAYLLQAQADLLQIPVAAYPGAYPTAQGAAALARLALDRTATLERETQAGPSQVKPVRPKWSADQAAAYRARWREAAGRARPALAMSAAA